MSWVTTRTSAPSAASTPTSLRSRSRDALSCPSVGSSRMTTAGSAARADAIATHLRSERPRSCGWTSSLPVRPQSSIARATPLSISAAPRPWTRGPKETSAKWMSGMPATKGLDGAGQADRPGRGQARGTCQPGVDRHPDALLDGWPVEDLLRRSVGQQPSSGQRHDPGAELGQFLEAVLDHHDRDATGVEPGQDLKNSRGSGRVEL